MANNRKPIFICAGFVVLLTLVVLISLLSVPTSQNKQKEDPKKPKPEKSGSAPNKSNKTENVTGTTERSGKTKSPVTITPKVGSTTKKPAEFKDDVDYSKDLDFILHGIRKLEISQTIAPGLMTVYGKNAFSILVKDFYLTHTNAPIASAGRYGKGRFAAFSHSTFFVTEAPSEFDNDQFLRNVVNWTVSSKPKAHIGICVYPQDLERFKRVLSQQEFVTYSDIKDCSNQKLENVTYLKEHDLLLLNDHTVNNNENIALREFVASGGGLILGSTPWSHINSKSEFFANKILKSFEGAVFSVDNDYYVGSGELNLARSIFNDTNGYQVWTDFKNILHNSQSIVGEDRLHQMEQILTDRIKFAPMDKNFSSEMVDEFQLLPITNKTFVTLTEPNLWAKFKQVVYSLKSKNAKATDALENIVHANSTVYSTILRDVISEFELFVRSSRTNLQTQSNAN